MLDTLKKDKTILELLSLFSLQPDSKVKLHQAEGFAGLGPFLASLYGILKKNILYVGASEEKTRTIFGDCSLFMDKAYFFPMREPPPFDDPVSSGERLAILDELSKEKNLFLFSTPRAILLPTHSPVHLKESRTILRQGEHSSLQKLVQTLGEWGYVRADAVLEKREFSVRGGIVDLFPLSAEDPYRIEWYGEEIDSIRTFNPATQRSISKVPSLELFPPEKGETNATLLDYLSPETLVVTEPEIFQDEETNLALLLDWIKEHPSLNFVSVPESDSNEWPFKPEENFTHRFREFLERAQERIRAGEKIFIFTRQASRLKEVLAENLLQGIEVIPSPLSQGFCLESQSLHVYTDAELFGRVVSHFRRISSSRPFAIEELSPGDIVVHASHGIARFEGLVPIDVGGNKQDYLALAFQKNDRLYIPLEEMGQVERYVGPPGRTPALSKLGGQEWKNAKNRAKKGAEEVAQDLVKLYAARSQLPGHAYSKDTPWQREVEEAFPFEETPDQIKAVVEAKEDMEKPEPMDRLVVGDVGYGKTEVALRAAFKAVMDGKQAAILVPTTILAQQHYETFTERLATFPVRVEILSRFKTKKEQQQVLLRLFSGEIDILIGTHRILQKDVYFKNLGLIIVDEEQRFGVAHKEALKKLKQNVDVLTLSATPIPRTFYLSLMGVRDISVIDTPPKERLPVKTFVAVRDPELVRKIILQELERGGQVYYLYNRVEKLAEKEKELKSLVPHARIVTAHGQMKGEKLEEVMWEFMKGLYDCLLCTTIIENGLDIPRVNTLIVESAERLGLAQLYQLRGRVGRSDRQAYAYFFTLPHDRLSHDAERRLETIQEFTALGSGYHIAARDLEIRGAGNLLGLTQHGHAAAVGYHLYCHLLGEEIKKQKGEAAPPPVPSIHLDLPVSAFIPSEYVPARSQKLDIYRRLALCKNFQEVDEIFDEILDRFGDPPEQVMNLFELVKLRITCLLNHVYEIKVSDGKITVRFWDGRNELSVLLGSNSPVKVSFDLLKSKIPVI